MDVYEFIEQIKKRPKMYVGNYGLIAVCMLIHGFILNDVVSHRESIGEKEYLRSFDVWVKKEIESKYRLEIDFKKNYIDAINMIPGDEDKKISIYFDFISAFLSQID